MRNLNLNTSYKHHIIVAVVIAVWLYLFQVLIAPFDTSELSFPIRLQILPPYGFITFVGYMLLVLIQNWFFKKKNQWNLLYEIIFILLFSVILLLGSFAYYKTDIINGDYSFSKFTFQVYYPIFFIILPILLFLRWWLSRKAMGESYSKIVLRGANKLDVLNIRLKDLVCISSADNYVEVSFLENDVLRKKLLRITLKEIQPQEPSLIKVHRSHLINPLHFIAWKNSNTLLLTQMEIPISKTYKKDILALEDSPLKPNDSPQTL
ncbi:LytTR family DNA-binding domain-containing protein [Maribacter sp. 2308TA10-17]|uniref:LytTR family DNA-binding domain-containing protein n=1 Tax=Maribacter sp. 2308TA10-17 TaxID=3386276 RepID=UPI0039BD3CCE